MNDIDNRIVSLRFDNEGFEKAAQATLDVLDKVDAKLGTNFSSKAFDTLNKVAGEVDLSPISDQLENVENSFSALESFLFGVFSRLGQKAADLGLNIANSLTVDQIKSGWSKYETILGAQQLIVAAQPDIEEDELLELMNKLSWYTDETSFNLEDMTTAIRSFMQQGIGLEDAVDAILGIANATGAAGGNAEKAQHAMEGFSKAMGQGYLFQETWGNQIKTSGINTKEFTDTLIKTAYELGRLKKDKNGYFFETESQKKGVERWDVNAGTISQLFRKENREIDDYVFNSEVITETLQKYSVAVQDIYDKYQELNGELTTSEIITEYGDRLDQFSLKAFRLSQEASTLSQAIDSVFDATSSKWYSLFQLIFGTYKESVTTWTDIANNLYDLLVSPLDTVIEVVSEWRELTNDQGETGFEILKDSINDLFEVIFSVLEPIKAAWGDIFDPITSEDLLNATEKFRDFIQGLILTPKQQEGLQVVFDSIFGALKVILTPLKLVVGLGKIAFTILEGLTDIILNFLGAFRGLISGEDDFEGEVADTAVRLSDMADEALTLEKIIDKINGAFQKVADFLAKVFGKISDFIKDNKDTLEEYYISIKTTISKIAKWIIGIVDWIIDKVTSAFDTASGLLSKLFGKTKKEEAKKRPHSRDKTVGDGSVDVNAKKGFYVFGTNSKDSEITRGMPGMEEVTESVEEELSLFDRLSNVITDISDGSIALATGIASIISNIYKSLQPILDRMLGAKDAWKKFWNEDAPDSDVAHSLENIKNAWAQFTTWISSKWDTFISWLSGVWKKIKSALGDDGNTDMGTLLDNIKKLFLTITTGISEIFVSYGAMKIELGLSSFLNALADPLEAFADRIGKNEDGIGKTILQIAASLILLVVAINMMAKVNLEDAAGKLAVLLTSIASIAGLVWGGDYVKSFLDESGTKGDKHGASISSNIHKLAKIISEIAVACIIMAKAIKILTSINATEDQIHAAWASIAIIIALLTVSITVIELLSGKNQGSKGFTFSLKKGISANSSKNITNVGKVMIETAVALLIVIGAIALLIKVLSSNNVVNHTDIIFISVGLIVSFLLIFFVLIKKITDSAKASSSHKSALIGAATTVLAITAAMYLMISALKGLIEYFSSEEFTKKEDIWKNIGATVAAFIIFGIIAAMITNIIDSISRIDADAWDLAIVITIAMAFKTLITAFVDLVNGLKEADSPGAFFAALVAWAILFGGFIAALVLVNKQGEALDTKSLSTFCLALLGFAVSALIMSHALINMAEAFNEYGLDIISALGVIMLIVASVLGIALLMSKVPGMDESMIAFSISVGILSLALNLFAWGLQGLAESIIFIIEAFISGQEELKEAIVRFTELIPLLGNVFVQIIDTICTVLATSIPRIAVTFAEMLLEFILQTLALLAEYVPQMVPYLQTIWNALVPVIIVFIRDIIDIIIVEIAHALPLVETIIESVIFWLEGQVDMLIGWIMEEVSWIIDWILEELGVVVVGIEDLIGGKPDGILTWIMREITIIINWLAKTLTGATHIITDPIKELMGTIEDMLTGKGDPKGIITFITETVSGLLKSAEDFLTGKGDPKGIITFIEDTISEFLDWLVNPVTGVISKIRSGWRQLFGKEDQNDVAIQAASIISTIEDGLSDEKQIEAIKQKVDNVSKTVIDEFNLRLGKAPMFKLGYDTMIFFATGLGDATATEAVVSTGKYVVTGFIEGLNDPSLMGEGDYTSNANTVAGAAYALGQTAVKYLNEGAGVHSPSILGFIAGKFLDSGFAKGITESMGLSNKAAEDTGSSAIDSLLGSITKTDFSSVFDTEALSPTITPVVDMTNVDSASTDISEMLGGSTTIDLNSATKASKTTATDVSATMTASTTEKDTWDQLLAVTKSTNEQVTKITDSTSKGFNTMGSKLDTVARACKYAGDKEISINFNGTLNELIRNLSDKLSIEGRRKSAY